MKSADADEIPCGDEVRLGGGWVDLISSEAKPKTSSEPCEDFIVHSTISSNDDDLVGIVDMAYVMPVAFVCFCVIN